MDIYSRIRSVWEKIKKQENAHPTETQDSSGDARAYSQRSADYHHITPYEVQHRANEQGYWKEQLRLAKKLNRLTKKLNCITIWGIAATFFSLVLLGGTLVVTIWNAQEDKRAWVGIGNITVLDKLTAGKPLRIRVGITNSGESPAVHTFTVGYSSFLVRMEEDKRFFFSGDSEYASCIGPKPGWGDTSGGAIILPGTNTMFIDRQSPVVPEMFVKLMASDNPSKEIQAQTLTPSDIEAVRTMRTAPDLPSFAVRKRMSLYIVGCVNYFDAFRAAHRTTFCFEYAYDSVGSSETGGAFIPCEGDNDAD